MKKIIDGKVYDTERAELIESDWYSTLRGIITMNKYYKLMILVIFIFFCSSCAVRTLQDIEKKRSEGDKTVVYFEHNWGEVYDAVKYVIQHSSVYPIAEKSKVIFYCIDYEKDKKTIFIYFSKYEIRDSVDMVIYFEPISKTKTKVEFVDGSYMGNTLCIRYIIDESKFYLSHDEVTYETFREYTIKNIKKYQKDLDENTYKK